MRIKLPHIPFSICDKLIPSLIKGVLCMINSPWWNMFEDYGTVELYLLYRVMEEQRRKNARNENSGSDIDRSKFK